MTKELAIQILRGEVLGTNEQTHEAVFMAIKALKNAPTLDAVPVVRCKDCKHYREGKVLSPQKFCFRLRGRNGEAIGYNFADDDFCSYGERSEE